MIWLRTAIFTLFVPGTITVGGPYLLLSSPGESASVEFGLFRLLGIVPLVLGIAFYLWCAWDFAVAGRGTPAPWDAPRQLVSRGLYRIVRNPIYVGVVLILLGEALLFSSSRLLIYALLVWVFFFLAVLVHEEPTLSDQFGASYDQYRRTVPRWLPRWRRQQS